MTDPQSDAGEKMAENKSADMEIERASDLLMSVSVRADVNKSEIIKLTKAAMEEIKQLIIEQEALWVHDEDAGTYSLNTYEYKRRFSPLDPTLAEILTMLKTDGQIHLSNLDNACNISPEFELASLQRESSFGTGLVYMTPVNLVEMFLNVDHWSMLFSSIVTKAKLLEVLSKGEGGSLDGTLQVMAAEFHISSPLVRTRESYFARYCKQLSLNTWAVVDVSLESIFPSPTARFVRRPSGCFIQAMENGYSKVTWIEHTEVDNTLVHHLFEPLLRSGSAFSAKRWLETLASQCDRFATYMDDRVNIIQDGRRSLLKVADRMMRSYYAGLSYSTDNIWQPIPTTGAENILVTTKYNDDNPEAPLGVSITVATTIWLQAKQENVFEFLQNGDNRNQWDLLSLNRRTREATCLATGHNSTNRVSIIAVDGTSPLIFYLQETQKNSTGSYVVYAPIDLFAVNSMLEGGNPNDIQILASGFAVLPNRLNVGEEENDGTLLTIAFHIKDEDASTPEYLPPKSVLTLYNIINETASLITAALTNQC